MKWFLDSLTLTSSKGNDDFKEGFDMKYYVYFIDEHRIERCNCFEENKEEAKHFASLVNGRVHYGY